MPRIPSLTSLRDSGLVLTAAAVTALAVDELLAGRSPSHRAGAGAKVPPLSAPYGWLYRVDELGGRIRPATAGDIAAARAAAVLDGGDGVFGRGYATEEPLLPCSPGYSAAGVTYYRVVPPPPPVSPAAGVRAEVDQLRRAADRIRRTSDHVRQVFGDDWIAGGNDYDDRMHVWSGAGRNGPDYYDRGPRPILTVAAGDAEPGAGPGTAAADAAGLEVDVDEALALAEHVEGFRPSVAAAIDAVLDGEADALERRGSDSPDGRTARALAVAAAYLRESAGTAAVPAGAQA